MSWTEASHKAPGSEARKSAAALQYIAKHNYITFNKKQYKSTKGIPQGLCVSYILSSFYYANLEDA